MALSRLKERSTNRAGFGSAAHCDSYNVNLAMRLGECPGALSIIPLSTHQAGLIPEWGQPLSSSMAVRCRTRRPAPALPHAMSRSKSLRSSAWEGEAPGSRKDTHWGKRKFKREL